MINILLIQIILCFIIDLSGFIPSIESSLSKKLKYKCHIPKPFSCSLCMGFWINNIILLCTNEFTLPMIAFTCIISFLSKNITGFLRWTSEALIYIEDALYKLIR